jgi:hypothetical protein
MGGNVMQFLRAAAGIILGLAIGALPVQAQQKNSNIRGVITAFDGKMVSIKTTAGTMAMVEVPEKARISTTKPFGVSDIKPGMPLGVTTIRGAEGKTVAIDVRPIPPTAKQGLSPYDLAPNSTMTNAKLEGIVSAAGGQELTLNHGSGTVKVLLTDKTAMSQAAPGTRGDIKAGETIYVFASHGEGGKLTAVRLQVSKDGIKPTQ